MNDNHSDKTPAGAEVSAELVDDAVDAWHEMPRPALLDDQMRFILTAILPEHEKQVRAEVATELETEGKKIADEAAYKVAAGDDGGFSGVLRGASISWAAKFVRGDAR